MAYAAAEQLSGSDDFAVSAANFLDWERQNQVFEKMAISTGEDMNLTGAGEAVSLPAESVSRDYFAVLQAKPCLGRTFLPEEAQVGKNRSVILSYAVWKERFGGDLKIVGRQVTLNKESTT